MVARQASTCRPRPRPRPHYSIRHQPHNYLFCSRQLIDCIARHVRVQSSSVPGSPSPPALSRSLPHPFPPDTFKVPPFHHHHHHNHTHFAPASYQTTQTSPFHRIVPHVPVCVSVEPGNPFCCYPAISFARPG
ncbi:hypothetical protein LZ32DRAFT_317609 [Colletotrichum eremochloae]|nr:hypothetical protein LZ32DRAFT_317609 [Colletotrichum eremochloae]